GLANRDRIGVTNGRGSRPDLIHGLVVGQDLAAVVIGVVVGLAEGFSLVVARFAQVAPDHPGSVLSCRASVTEVQPGFATIDPIRLAARGESKPCRARLEPSAACRASHSRIRK